MNLKSDKYDLIARNLNGKKLQNKNDSIIANFVI